VDVAASFDKLTLAHIAQQRLHPQLLVTTLVAVLQPSTEPITRSQASMDHSAHLSPIYLPVGTHSDLCAPSVYPCRKSDTPSPIASSPNRVYGYESVTLRSNAY
jgi:hypothetical protein